MCVRMVSVQVVQCIHALGAVVQRSVPEFTGPRLGVRLASGHVRPCVGVGVGWGLLLVLGGVGWVRRLLLV
jgi:hypothetical protein